MSSNDEQDEFGRRAGELLRASSEGLDAATRSRLTRARAAALEARTQPRSWLSLRTLAPAGAVAAVAFATVLFIGHGHGSSPVNDSGSNALYDMELLADTDALDIGQESDLDFVEWAASQGEQDEAGG